MTLHWKDLSYLNRVVVLDGGNFAIPDDYPIGTDGLPVIQGIDHNWPATFVELPGDFDGAMAELALRLSLDEWHLEIRWLLSTNSRFRMGDKVWAVYDGVGVAEALEDVIESKRESFRVDSEIDSFIDWDRWNEVQREKPRAEWLAPFDHGEDIVEIESDIGPLQFYIYRIK